MAYLARWPEWLHACVLRWMTTEDSGNFHSSGRLHSFSLLSVLWLFAILMPFFLLPHLACSFRRFLAYFSFAVIFSLFHPASLSICSLFLSASPPLRCQHFTVDIQLLAGHSIVIPFRAAPFSVGPSNSHSNYNPGCLRSWRPANCCFQTFLGPPPNLIPQI